MDGLLILAVLSCVILRVHSNCDLQVCSRDVDDLINNPFFCNTTSMQTLAVKSLRKCVYYEPDDKECPENVRLGTAGIANKIQDRWTACGLPQGRASCNGADYFVCIGGLGGFAFIGNSFSIADLTASCIQLKQLLVTLDVCKSCVGNFFGTAWTDVQADVERIWGIATNVLNGACDCAAKLKVEIDKIDQSSTCKFVQSISKTAAIAARDCAANLVNQVVVFDWVTITNNYIQTVLTFTSNACFFIGGGAGVAAISISAVILVILTHLMRNL